MSIVFTPEVALRTYRGNIEGFDQAVPILTLIGDHIIPIVLDLPDDDMAEQVAPEVIRNIPKLMNTERGLTQAVLSVEAEVMHKDRPFAGQAFAVVVYSAGVEEYRMVAPFQRDEDRVVWKGNDLEVVIGQTVERDPVIGALRYLIEQSR